MIVLIIFTWNSRWPTQKEPLSFKKGTQSSKKRGILSSKKGALRSKKGTQSSQKIILSSKKNPEFQKGTPTLTTLLSQCLEVVDDVSPKLLSWKFQQKKYALAVLFRDLKPGFWCWSKWKVLRKFWFASDFNRLWVIFISELLIQGILWRLGETLQCIFAVLLGA